MTLLLGTRNTHFFKMLDVRCGKTGETWPFLSPLGWVVIGPAPPEVPNAAMINVGHLLTQGEVVGKEEEAFEPKVEYMRLRRQVERLWNHKREAEVARLRNLSSRPLKTEAQLEAENIFKNTVKLVQGTYEVGLIWKKGKGLTHLPDNYFEARRIYPAQEKRLEHDPLLHAEYVRICTQWLKEKSFVEIPHESLSPGFFIPHFMVIRLDKTMTKYRSVMHRAMSFNDHSINDFLECGLNQVANLLHILLRMRQGEFVFTGD